MSYGDVNPGIAGRMVGVWAPALLLTSSFWLIQPLKGSTAFTVTQFPGEDRLG